MNAVDGDPISASPVEATVKATAPPQPRPTQETCDACGPFVVAAIGVELPSGRRLTYCGHHGRKYAVGLTAQAKSVFDLGGESEQELDT